MPDRLWQVGAARWYDRAGRGGDCIMESEPHEDKGADVQRVTLVVMLLMLAGGGAALADDWPQWLGPGRSGISTETCREPLTQAP